MQGLELRIGRVCLVVGMIGESCLLLLGVEVGAEGGLGVRSDKVVSENYNQA